MGGGPTTMPTSRMGCRNTSAGGGRCLKAIPVNPSGPMTGETGRNGGSIVLRRTIHALTTEDDSTAMDSTYVPAYRWRNRDYQPVDSMSVAGANP